MHAPYWLAVSWNNASCANVPFATELSTLKQARFLQVLDVTGFLKYAVQAAAMFETRFNSVERLMAYFDLPQEAPRHIEATKCAIMT